ncbi:NAD(P)-binding domain-containing protein, partial [Priestia megaterium]|uniref:NAD(P)-binding domain-containing protein n=1 Tax=Priestia megaterium TaxID=1404 RepID=UPI00399FA65E
MERGRVVWVMVGDRVVDCVISEVRGVLGEGDMVIEGGNSDYKECIGRYKELKEKKM